ncbi:MAG TPA: multidrug effflux MFS transporter [Rhizomicrobium sp.]|jgi:DHA1 family bicyclomycin/chloramphenicol resistance-like MFS transporter
MTPAPSDSFTRAQRIELIALFGVLTVFTPIGIDLYLPALPTIAADFQSPISVIEQSLATFFLGLCLGQAMIGPISDRFGRRWPILIGLLLYIAGATACALSEGPITLNLARFVEAVGGCAGTVLARACVRDLFPPHEAARIFAQMLMILSVSPLFAPFVGGWLLPITGWRSLFWLQGAAAALTWGVVWKMLPESHPGSDRRLHPLHVMADYWAIARDRRFFRFVIPATLTGGGLYAFLTGWPHVVEDIFRVRPEYFGFTFVLNGIGLVVFSQGAARWLRNHPGEPLFFACLATNATAGVLAVVSSWLGWGGLFTILPFTFVYCAMIGSINATGSGLAMVHFGHAAGMASALIGILLYGGGTLASALMGAFPTPATAVPLTGLMAAFGVLGVATYLLFRPRASG